MDHLSGIFESLAVPFENIATGINSILNYLNPLHEKFFLKVALIPSQGYFDTYFTDIKTVFDSKFPLITQIHDLLESIANVAISGNIPEFEVTFNGKYGNGTYSIIDFSYFTQYREYILTFIRVFMWFYFIKNLYRQLPNMIYK